MSATSIATLAYRLRKTETEVREACREFEELQLGRYVPGRWSSPSRFEWFYPIKEIGAVATGAKDSLDHGPLTPVEAEDSFADHRADIKANSMATRFEESTNNRGTNSISHKFKLRADYEVEIVLPQDLTSAEAARLARFVTSLPFSANLEA